jgi:hypothetical protein
MTMEVRVSRVGGTAISDSTTVGNDTSKAAETSMSASGARALVVSSALSDTVVSYTSFASCVYLSHVEVDIGGAMPTRGPDIEAPERSIESKATI